MSVLLKHRGTILYRVCGSPVLRKATPRNSSPEASASRNCSEFRPVRVTASSDELQRSSGLGIRRKTEDPRDVGGGERFVVAQGEYRNKCLQCQLLREMRGIAIQRDDCERMFVPECVHELGGSGAPALVARDGDKISQARPFGGFRCDRSLNLGGDVRDLVCLWSEQDTMRNGPCGTSGRVGPE
jgi:hypothetical protein